MRGTTKREHFGVCSNNVMLYVPPLGRRKRKVCYVPDFPESLLPELGSKDLNKDGGSSERVGESKEAICMFGGLNLRCSLTSIGTRCFRGDRWLVGCYLPLRPL